MISELRSCVWVDKVTTTAHFWLFLRFWLSRKPQKSCVFFMKKDYLWVKLLKLLFERLRESGMIRKEVEKRN